VRGLTRRIVLSALAGAILCGCLALLGVMGAATGFVSGMLADPHETLGAEAIADCASNPEWEARVGFHDYWAYTVEGISTHPGAPPLQPGWIPAEVGEVHQLYGLLSRPWERSAVHRLADDGPCAVIFASSPGKLDALPTLRIGAVFGLLLGMVAVLLGTMSLAVRPLLARLRHLDDAASLVGQSDYRPVGDATGDELGRVARTVDASHERIVAHEAELRNRHALLEKHLAAVAHDLRTPLASLQLSLEDLGGRVPADLEIELGEVRLEVGSLEALADNLLQASRLQGGLDVQGSGAEVELGAVLSRLATRFGILGRARNITVNLAIPDEPVSVRCEPSLAERALANLVHNTCVHGRADHPVGLSLDLRGGRFELAVQSAGKVMSPADLEVLAARRLTVPDPSRTRADGGLGIRIANEVAERAGWQVRYIAVEDGGLRVEISGRVQWSGGGEDRPL